MFLETELGMSVQVSPPLGHLVVKALDAIWNLHEESRDAQIRE
jgi:hypothetical protein